MDHSDHSRRNGFTIFDALPEEQRKELLRKFGCKDRRPQEVPENKTK
jgi:hypothetical protein